MQNRFNRIILSLISVLFLLATLAPPSTAEDVTQTITLEPGWNAVFLEVDPVSSDCADVFAGVTDLESVWTWNPRISTVEYIQDPDTLIPSMPQWLVYLPGNTLLTNLHAIFGETAYLINLGGTQDVDWVVTGTPRLPRIKWKPDSFNLVGFHLETNNEPTFKEFFESSPAHTAEEIYKLKLEEVDQDTWMWIWVMVDPENDNMARGEAYWVYCRGHSEFTGPLSVQLDQSDGLHYGKVLSEQNIRLLNNSAGDADISIALSQTGDATLSYWKFDPDNDDVGWRDLPLDLTIGVAGKETMRMGARRSGLTPDQVYESNLEISNNAGMFIVVPVSVEGISHTGLWVGSAVINKVSEPANATDPTAPTKTGSTLSFRLILHVDDSGKVKLLKQAIQMWDEVQSRYVIFTDDNLMPNYLGDVSAQGPAVRRISSAAFSELSASEPKFEADMSGTFDEANGNLSCTITVRPDDPLNPFRHKYHPDHGDINTAYQVTRTIDMEFTTQDADGNPITSAPVLAWGGSDMGGIYRETLTGLHKTDINVEGIFLLHKVSSVSQLESQ